MNMNDIYKIMDSLASDGKAFSNEQDFQFEFARALNPFVTEIKLEALSLDQNWAAVKSLADSKRKIGKQAKEYTDIIAKTKDGKYIAIELKFKTPDKLCYYETAQSGRVLTMIQDAHFKGAYQFINDVFRLEQINQRHFCKEFDVSKGYAILLTNNHHYRYNDFSTNYAVSEGKTLGPGILKYDKGDPQFLRRQYPEIQLSGQYTMKWKDYALMGLNGQKYNDYEDKYKTPYPGFSYLVIEVSQKAVKNAAITKKAGSHRPHKAI